MHSDTEDIMVMVLIAFVVGLMVFTFTFLIWQYIIMLEFYLTILAEYSKLTMPAGLKTECMLNAYGQAFIPSLIIGIIGWIVLFCVLLIHEERCY